MAASSRKVTLIGVPTDMGASKRGSAGGPNAIRLAGVVRHLEALGCEVDDTGDVPVPKRKPKVGHPSMKYRSTIHKICEETAQRVYEAHDEGRLPVVLGGDHSLAMGSVSGTSKYYADEGKSVGLIWVDAHGDINTPKSSPSGNVHGMPLAHLLGMDTGLGAVMGRGAKVAARNVCLIGIRDVDASERINLRESGIKVFTMKDIDRHGMARVVEQAIEIAADQTDGIHVSYDIDAVDPAIAKGTGTPSRGGLTYRESHLLMELVADSELLVSLDMVEINPMEDVQNQTAGLASELIQSALGKRIY